ncbi:hypothetical protein ABH917_001443 [Thermobifida halotolerans]
MTQASRLRSATTRHPPSMPASVRTASTVSDRRSTLGDRCRWVSASKMTDGWAHTASHQDLDPLPPRARPDPTAPPYAPAPSSPSSDHRPRPRPQPTGPPESARPWSSPRRGTAGPHRRPPVRGCRRPRPAAVHRIRRRGRAARCSTRAPGDRRHDRTGGRPGLPADFPVTSHGRVAAARYGEHVYDQWSVDEPLELAARATRPTPPARCGRPRWPRWCPHVPRATPRTGAGGRSTGHTTAAVPAPRMPRPAATPPISVSSSDIGRSQWNGPLTREGDRTVSEPPVPPAALRPPSAHPRPGTPRAVRG